MASLLQSAVKLDDQLHGDDDEYEHTEASLESLRKEKAPPLPDTQDRKRFVGCLASVLAFLSNQPWCTPRQLDVYERLLKDAAELLQLEATQSKCFLPMLRDRSIKIEPLPRGCDHSMVIRHIPFLESFLTELTCGAGLRCLCLLLTQHLLSSKNGYDARTRHALRVLGVVVLFHDNPDGRPERQFEALEQGIAWKLILLSNPNPQQVHHNDPQQHRSSLSNPTPTRNRIVRGLKIGGTAVAAGTLFAISGGIAAPAIVSALAGTALASVAALSTTAAATAVFGVTGGSLVAYKMQRRTVGLTEFDFVRHTETYELVTTICLSGWLEQEWDFERPWGVKTDIDDPVERLERFYQIVRPCHVRKAKKIVQAFRDNEVLLYAELWKTYGADPNNMYPLGPRPALSPDDQESLDGIFQELQLGSTDETPPPQQTPLERLQKLDEIAKSFDSSHSNESEDDDPTSPNDGSDQNNTDSTTKPPKHLKTVWDYQNRYGGELYTVRWESKLLLELCDSVVDLAADLVTGATTQILRHTALATLVAAVALPVALTSAANMIDGTWTLVVERADAAGKELAQSLLYSSAGHRPVALVGFSFGARVIYTCLKELARYQQQWEEFHQKTSVSEQVKRRMRRRRNSDGEDESAAFESMREPASIVGDVSSHQWLFSLFSDVLWTTQAILMGLPNHLSLTSWEAIRGVVAGRLVNCFSQKDLILSLMFQIKKFGGLKPGMFNSFSFWFSNLVCCSLRHYSSRFAWRRERGRNGPGFRTPGLLLRHRRYPTASPPRQPVPLWN